MTARSSIPFSIVVKAIVVCSILLILMILGSVQHQQQQEQQEHHEQQQKQGIIGGNNNNELRTRIDNVGSITTTPTTIIRNQYHDDAIQKSIHRAITSSSSPNRFFRLTKEKQQQQQQPEQQRFVVSSSSSDQSNKISKQQHQQQLQQQQRFLEKSTIQIQKNMILPALSILEEFVEEEKHHLHNNNKKNKNDKQKNINKNENHDQSIYIVSSNSNNNNNNINNINNDSTKPTTIILHIGTFKTGTTSIQSDLNVYRKETTIHHNLSMLMDDDHYVIPVNSTVWEYRLNINMIGFANCFRLPNFEMSDVYTTPCDIDIKEHIETILVENNEIQQQDPTTTTTTSMEQKQHPIPHRDIILSSEYFSQFYVRTDYLKEYMDGLGAAAVQQRNGNEYKNENSLSSVPNPPPIQLIIVAYYRRYYDWLKSYWNEFDKKKPYQNRTRFTDFLYDTEFKFHRGSHPAAMEAAAARAAKAATSKEDTTDSIEQNDEILSTIKQLYYAGPYTFGTMQRYYDTFIQPTMDSSNENNNYSVQIKLYNMHDLPSDYSDDVRLSFFCDAIPGASHTCEELKERKKLAQEKEIEEQQRQTAIENNQKVSSSEFVVNKSVPMVYVNLLLEAVIHFPDTYGRNIDPSISVHGAYMKSLINQVSYYHEVTLQRQGEYDFDTDYIICPDSIVLKWLYERSIETERLYFPDYYNDRGGALTLEEDFQIASQTTLCDIDVHAVLLHDPEWQHFFLDLLQ